MLTMATKSKSAGISPGAALVALRYAKQSPTERSAAARNADGCLVRAGREGKNSPDEAEERLVTMLDAHFASLPQGERETREKVFSRAVAKTAEASTPP